MHKVTAGGRLGQVRIVVRARVARGRDSCRALHAKGAAFQMQVAAGEC